MITRFLRIVPVLAPGVMMLASCTTLRVPLMAPDVAAQELRRAAVDGIEVSVKAIESEGDYWRLFEEYLPRIGMVAVWVEVHNSGAMPVNLRRSDWSLQINDRKSAAMSSDQVFERFYEGFKVRAYSVQADRKARLRMEGVAWQSGGLAPSGRRAGYLFFRIDSATASAWTRQATLLLGNLQLGAGANATLKIVLAHANS